MTSQISYFTKDAFPDHGDAEINGRRGSHRDCKGDVRGVSMPRNSCTRGLSEAGRLLFALGTSWRGDDPIRIQSTPPA